MSVVRYLAHTNRLSKLINAPGGKTVDAAVADAEAGLLAIADACLADVDRLIGALIERSWDLTRPAGKDDVLYTASRDIAGLAAICRRPRLGEAAHSLCVLIDNSENAGRWHRDAIGVHISTLQLMRGMPDEGDGSIQGQLVASLQEMVARLSNEDSRPRAF